MWWQKTESARLAVFDRMSVIAIWDTQKTTETQFPDNRFDNNNIIGISSNNVKIVLNDMPPLLSFLPDYYFLGCEYCFTRFTF